MHFQKRLRSNPLELSGVEHCASQMPVVYNLLNTLFIRNLRAMHSVVAGRDLLEIKDLYRNL